MTKFLTLRPSRRWYGVLTPDGLLLREVDGTRRRIQWQEVLATEHATTTCRGMRWRLKLDEGWVEVRDVGIAPNRWGISWHAVVTEVGERGRPLRVDRISNMLSERRPVHADEVQPPA